MSPSGVATLFVVSPASGRIFGYISLVWFGSGSVPFAAVPTEGGGNCRRSALACFLLLMLHESFLVLCGFPSFVWLVLRVISIWCMGFVSFVLVGPGAAVPMEASCPLPCPGAGCRACSWGGSVDWGFVCIFVWEETLRAPTLALLPHTLGGRRRGPTKLLPMQFCR